MPIQHETELYQPVKQYLEKLGYEVKSEVRNCDLVAMRDEGEEPLIVELKKSFGLPLIYQGMDRLMISSCVYVAIEDSGSGASTRSRARRWARPVRLCRLLGLGLITVRFYKTRKPLVQVLCDPERIQPRQVKRKTGALIKEYMARGGDYNVGGSTRQKLVTAYRELALQCVHFIHLNGPLSPKQLRELTGEAKATRLLQDNHYHWFERVRRGVYDITPPARQALADYEHVTEQFEPRYLE